MRKLLFLFLLVVTGAQAQELKSKLTIVGVKLDGVFATLTKGDHYSVITPEGYPSSTIGISTKGGKSAQKQDYIFKVIPEGLANITVGDPIKYEDGYVRAYKYAFPVSVEVMNQSGELLKTFIVVQDDIVFSQLVSDSFFDYYGGAVSNIQRPFPDSITCASFTADHEEEILGKLCLVAWNNVSERINWTLTHAYGYSDFPDKAYSIISLKEPTPEQKDIQALCKLLMKTVNNLDPFVIDVSKSKQEKLAKLVDEFSKLLEDHRLSKNLRFLCLYNAATAATLSGREDKALEYYQQYMKISNAGAPVKYNGLPDNNTFMRYYYRAPMLQTQDDTINIPYIR